MSSFYGGNDTDPESYSVCPYDPKHLILNKRMATHLMKCARNFACSQMETCPYNAKHVYPRVQHQHHITHCPDRAIIDREILYCQTAGSSNNPTYSGFCDLPSYECHNYEGDDNWDDESGRSYFNAKNIPKEMVRLPANEPLVLEGDKKSEVEKRLQERRKIRTVNTTDVFLQSNIAGASGMIATNGAFCGSGASGSGDINGSAGNNSQDDCNLRSDSSPVVVGYGRGVPTASQPRATAEGLTIGRGRVGNQQQQRKVTTTPGFTLPGVGRGYNPF